MGETAAKWMMPSSVSDQVKILRGYFDRVDTDDRDADVEHWTTASQRYECDITTALFIL